MLGRKFSGDEDQSGTQVIVTAMVSFVGVYALIEMMIMLRTILQPLLFAGFLVVILMPCVDYLKWNFLCRPSESDPPRAKAAQTAAQAAAAFIVLLGFTFLLATVCYVIFNSVSAMHSRMGLYGDGALELTRDFHKAVNRTAEKFGLQSKKNGLDKSQLVDKVGDEIVHAVKTLLFTLVSDLLADMSEMLVRGVLIFLYLIFWLCQPIRMDGMMNNLLRRYIALKSFVNLIMGLCTGFLFVFLNIDLAWLFGFLTFLLNYIPEIGPLIAMMLPIPVIMLDGRVTTETRCVTLILALVGQLAFKFAFGNVLELYLIDSDKKMKMHPVIVLLGVAFFGYVWGPTGMLLSVPFMAIFKLLCLDDKSSISPKIRDNIVAFLEGDGGAPEEYRRLTSEGKGPLDIEAPTGTAK